MQPFTPKRWARVVGMRGGAAIASILTLTVGGKEAIASGISTTSYGFGQGMAQPALANPYSVFYNPAAMGGVDRGTEITLDGSLLLRTAGYKRPQSALSPYNTANGTILATEPTLTGGVENLYTPANTGTAKLLNLAALPYLGIVSNLGIPDFSIGHIRFGYAAYVPFGGTIQWGKNKAFPEGSAYGAAYDGAQRWANISASVLSIYNTLGVSFTFDPIRLSVGANVSAVYHTLSLTRAQNSNFSDEIYDPKDGTFEEGRAYVDVSGLNVAATFGLYWEPFEDRSFRVGASYAVKPAFGQMRLKGNLTQLAGNVPAETAKPTPIDLLQTYPDILRVGAAYRINSRWEVRGDIEYARWSEFTSQCIVVPGASCNVDSNGNASASGGNVKVNLPRDWHDAGTLRLGGAFWATPETEIFAQLAGATSAVPKSTIDASTIDSLNVGATVGVKHSFTSWFALAGSYNFIYLLPVDTDNTSIYHQNGQNQPNLSPSADGTYTSFLMFLNVAASFRF